MKVLLAVDGSAYTRKMVTYLTMHPEFLADVHAIDVLYVRPALPARVTKALQRDTLGAYNEEEAGKVLDPVVKRLARKFRKPKPIWKTGVAGDVIAKLASAGKYDLIVMGSHGHGGLRNLVMGSVATRVLAQCTVPVLLIR